MSGTVGAALTEAAARLSAAGVADPARDARVLMADALGTGTAGVTPALREPLPAEAAERFAAHVAARARRRPVSQILGRRAFWGRSFELTDEALDPRPETETLVACALEGPAPARVLDLGVGSGVILVTLLAEWPDAHGVGTDVDPGALVLAARNAARHGVAGRAEFLRADWAEGVSGRFDLVVSNPPYIPAADVAGLAPEVRDWEPHLALTPGPSGLESYRRIATCLPALLAPGGRVLLEFGAGQGPDVVSILRSSGFSGVSLRRDLDDRYRVADVVAALET